MKLESGHTVIYASKDENEVQKKKFLAYSEGVITLEPGNWCFPVFFQNYANEIYNFKFRPSDVVVMTYPKCGTTWMQEILWTMRNNPNLNNPKAAEDTSNRVPFMEADFIMSSPKLPQLPLPENVLKQMAGSADKSRFFINCAKNIPNPRTIKTHLPFSLLQKNLLDICKVVYVMRNPRDVCVSYLHHHRLWTCHDYTGSNDEFVDFFINDKLMFSPIWGLLKEAWAQRNHPNLFIVFYETLKSNPREEIQRLNNFLGTNLNETQIENIISHTSFSNMKKRSDNNVDAIDDEIFMNMEVFKSDGGMFRKGISGDGKNILTEDQSKKIDDWINKHVRSLGADFLKISKY